MQTKNNLVLIIAVWFLVACVTTPNANVSVRMGESPSLDFTGKGTAAGIMLDSVMGGAGIAIGIAIDKGIAKDIANNLNHHNPPLNVIDNFNRQLKAAIAKNQVNRLQNVEVVIEHYGFKTFFGGEDLVSAWLEVNVIIDGRKSNIRYPENFDHVDSAGLSSVKGNPDIAYALISNAIERVSNDIANSVKH